MWKHFQTLPFQFFLLISLLFFFLSDVLYANTIKKSTNPLNLKMVYIKSGSFQMGCVSNHELCSDDEKPIHPVQIKPFFISATEITFAQWDACVMAKGCSHKPDDEGWGRDQRPVINISWDDAQQFVTWLSGLTNKIYRLPTEAEWEYAARGEGLITTLYAWGDNEAFKSNKANCSDCGSQWGDKKTAPVASFPAYHGLYDMHGNVWEWTQDCYHTSYNNAPTIGEAWRENCYKYADDGEVPLVLRGGAWDDGHFMLGLSNRGDFYQNARLNNIGFRIVRAK